MVTFWKCSDALRVQTSENETKEKKTGEMILILCIDAGEKFHSRVHVRKFISRLLSEKCFSRIYMAVFANKLSCMQVAIPMHTLTKVMISNVRIMSNHFANLSQANFVGNRMNYLRLL